VRRLPDSLEELHAAGKAGLARCLSALETASGDAGLGALLDAAHAAPRGLVVGLTGPPGVGKSTLINALIGRLRTAGRTVAVIAVDPSSRRSRGALLGDRTRIGGEPGDAGVFVRSMAARERLGGLAALTYPAAVLMRALYDVVIIETVGVGQSETEIAECSDLVVFCAQPGAGDALQFMKAGIMEVPDIVLVTKGDLGAAARRTAADLRGALALASGAESAAEVTVVSAETGEGVDAAIDRVLGQGVALADSGALQQRRAGQVRAWVDARLTEAFGREGAALLSPARFDLARPFGGLSQLHEAARSAVKKALQGI
jgi:LAO/AO transport system kinase